MNMQFDISRMRLNHHRLQLHRRIAPDAVLDAVDIRLAHARAITLNGTVGDDFHRTEMQFAVTARRQFFRPCNHLRRG